MSVRCRQCGEATDPSGPGVGVDAGAAVKRLFDIVAAGLGLVVVGPVLLVAAAGIVATMGRPVFYRDRRSGRKGQAFDLLKFRTMRGLRPGERIPDDDAARLTRLGAVLRKTSIDELPALLNVLRGEMSLIGPRPLPVRYLERYSDRQRRRLEVRPGISGWAQVNGRNLLSWDERFELDVWYVDNRSLRLDLSILLKTLTAVAGARGVSPTENYTMPEFLGSPRLPADAAESVNTSGIGNDDG